MAGPVCQRRPDLYSLPTAVAGAPVLTRRRQRVTPGVARADRAADRSDLSRVPSARRRSRGKVFEHASRRLCEFSALSPGVPSPCTASTFGVLSCVGRTTPSGSRDVASAKVNDPEFRRRTAQASADALSAAAGAAGGLEAVVHVGGLTDRDAMSKLKVGKALLTPMQPAKGSLVREAESPGRAASQPRSASGGRRPAQGHPAALPVLLRDRTAGTAGKPLTAHNTAAVAGLTSANLALNAERWLHIVGSPGGCAAVERRVSRRGPGPRRPSATPPIG